MNFNFWKFEENRLMVRDTHTHTQTFSLSKCCRWSSQVKFSHCYNFWTDGPILMILILMERYWIVASKKLYFKAIWISFHIDKSQKRKKRQNFQVKISMVRTGRFSSLNAFSGPMDRGLSRDISTIPNGLIDKKFETTCIYASSTFCTSSAFVTRADCRPLWYLLIICSILCKLQ